MTDIDTKRLTWNELAEIYDRVTGKTARIQPMEKITEWAVRNTDMFVVDEDDYICLRENQP